MCWIHTKERQKKKKVKRVQEGGGERVDKDPEDGKKGVMKYILRVGREGCDGSSKRDGRGRAINWEVRWSGVDISVRRSRGCIVGEGSSLRKGRDKVSKARNAKMAERGQGGVIEPTKENNMQGKEADRGIAKFVAC